MKITNPHDKLFREVWSDKAVAADFLQNYLPEDVLKLVDLSTLEISKDSFIEKELKDYYSDLLYKINLADKPGYVYFLFEHKSYKDRLAPLQVLEYMPKIWRLHLKQHKTEPLPVIIPMFLYHGQGKWKHTKFSDLMDNSASLLSAYVPDFEYVMLDLTQYSDTEIKGLVLSRVVMMLFKHISDPDIIDKLPAVFSLMREIVEAEEGLRYFEAMLRYVVSTLDISDEEIKNVVETSVSKEKGEIIMTTIERWMNEGYELGIQFATRRGYIRTIDLGLKLKFPDQYQIIMPLIHKLEDNDKLEKIADSIEAIKHAPDLIKLITY